MTSANKGEWSELYALGYLLVNGGGFAANEFANLDKSIFYKVLEVVDNPSGTSETVYRLGVSEITVLQNGIGVIQISKSQIEPRLKAFFDDLCSESGSASFGLQSGETLLKLLMKTKLSASSSLTNDLHLILEDHETKIPTPRRGFNVKSEIGHPATIFNAGVATNLTYKIIGEGAPKQFHKVSAVKTNLKSLKQDGFTLKFLEYDNKTLYNNLLNIDSNLPEFLAELMLAYYQSTTTKIRSICEDTWAESHPEATLKVSKIKKFLSAASMGLRPNTVWSGYPEDFGGLLLVKKNGHVLFYYLYNLQKFEEYLFGTLRFDTPDTSKHKFGQVYFVEGEPRIKLNLQIRY
jgi:type II restriction enzyme